MSHTSPRPPTLLDIPDHPGAMRHLSGPAPSRPWEWLGRSVLASIATAMPDSADLVAWSGSFAELDGGSLFDEDPRTWGPKGWDALRRACESAGPDRSRLILRPHARHVLSDIPGCRKLLAADWAAGVRILLDPRSMCTPAMLADDVRDDHLRRIMEAAPLLESGLAGVVIDDAGPLKDLALACTPGVPWCIQHGSIAAR